MTDNKQESNECNFQDMKVALPVVYESSLLATVSLGSILDKDHFINYMIVADAIKNQLLTLPIHFFAKNENIPTLIHQLRANVDHIIEMVESMAHTMKDKEKLN